ARCSSNPEIIFIQRRALPLGFPFDRGILVCSSLWDWHTHHLPKEIYGLSLKCASSLPLGQSYEPVEDFPTRYRTNNRTIRWGESRDPGTYLGVTTHQGTERRGVQEIGHRALSS